MQVRSGRRKTGSVDVLATTVSSLRLLHTHTSSGGSRLAVEAARCRNVISTAVGADLESETDYGGS